MRVHYLQHVPFEGIGAIGEWTRNRAHDLSSTEMFRVPTPALPRVDELDFLVVMGGPMNVYQEAEYPWFSAEKTFIASTIMAGKPVLGICLGAQLVADVLGGPVSKGEHPEIGWYTVELTEAGRAIPVFAGFPSGSPPSTGMETRSPSPREPSTWRRRKPAPTRLSLTAVAEWSRSSSTWKRRGSRWSCSWTTPGVIWQLRPRRPLRASRAREGGSPRRPNCSLPPPRSLPATICSSGCSTLWW